MNLDSAWRFTVLGYHAGFAQPWYLLTLVAVGALAVLLVRSALQRRARVRALIGERLEKALTPGVSVTRPVVKASLSSAGLVLFALALAQPQCGSRSELTKRRGIDLVVALDASKSMFARDVAPNRITRATLELQTLLDELKGDRVALVAFAGEAFIQCPLTSDYEALRLFLRAVDPMQMPQGGTDIGAALELSRTVLESTDRGAAEKVIVLISDGEDISGDVAKAVEQVKEAGIRVLAVGIGSETGEPIPLLKDGQVVGYQKDQGGETVLTRLDRAGMTALAEQTGGEFFYEPRGVAMGQVVERIDQFQKSELESRISVRYAERFQYYLLPGLALILLGMFLPTTRSQPKPRRSREAA
ncbi:MAG: VWA domain-containing protein [Myxococcota bacterium]|nr:VWA domain-containing protein [Myxococcota bacterium]